MTHSSAQAHTPQVNVELSSGNSEQVSSPVAVSSLSTVVCPTTSHENFSSKCDAIHSSPQSPSLPTPAKSASSSCLHQSINMHLCYLNSRSLINKLSNFQSYAPYNIYCITETWLSNSIFDCEILPCNSPLWLYTLSKRQSLPWWRCPHCCS